MGEQHTNIGRGFTAVVAGCDGSDESMEAAEWAAALAAGTGARLRLIDAIPRSYAEMPPEDAREREAAAREELLRRVETAGVVPDSVEAVDAPADEALRSAAETADVLVIGSTSFAGVGAHGFFSLAHELAHEVPCPLVVVPRGHPLRRDAPLVVGLDGSDGSLVALRWAVRIAARLHAPVVGVYVVDEIFGSVQPDGWYGEDEEDARLQASMAPIEFVERVGADPAVELAQLAAERGAAAVVVGARTRRSLGGALLGKIPDELLHHPTVPVAVVSHEYTEAVLHPD